MKYNEAFEVFHGKRTDELVVTSAGNSSKTWWHITRDKNGSFYLDASMSLGSMFASGIAFGNPERTVWCFMGDGAFCMNPGMLLVERDMGLANLFHILVSNRGYGATSNLPLPNRSRTDYVALAKSVGIDRVYLFDKLETLVSDFDAVFKSKTSEHTFVVLEVEPLSIDEQRSMKSPPFDGPELKYQFGRHMESISKRRVFDHVLE